MRYKVLCRPVDYRSIPTLLASALFKTVHQLVEFLQREHVIHSTDAPFSWAWEGNINWIGAGDATVIGLRACVRALQKYPN